MLRKRFIKGIIGSFVLATLLTGCGKGEPEFNLSEDVKFAEKEPPAAVNLKLTQEYDYIPGVLEEHREKYALDFSTLEINKTYYSEAGGSELFVLILPEEESLEETYDDMIAQFMIMQDLYQVDASYSEGEYKIAIIGDYTLMLQECSHSGTTLMSSGKGPIANITMFSNAYAHTHGNKKPSDKELFYTKNDKALDGVEALTAEERVWQIQEY